MKVYTAGSWAAKTEILELVQFLELRVHDFSSTSSWLATALTEAEVEKVGPQPLIDEDYWDIGRADVMLIVNAKGLSSFSPGKWIELGYAIASGKLCVVWGNDQTTLFLQDRNVIWLPEDSRAELVLTLNAIRITLNSVDLGDPSAHRTDSRVIEDSARGRAATSPYENRGEGARPGIRKREGGPLRDLVRAIRSRVARPDGD